jgi:hypothetical protein
MSVVFTTKKRKFSFISKICKLRHFFFVNTQDPDAPTRQRKQLHDLDQENEYELIEYVFAFIRAGDLKSARDLCVKLGQSWRAATLEGFKLFCDDNYSLDEANMETNSKEKKLFENQGNFSRDIWRLMAYKLIKDVSFFFSPILNILEQLILNLILNFNLKSSSFSRRF